MKLKINSEVIASLSPCNNRHQNWLTHYQDFNDDVLVFLNLPNITPQDKIWVCVRVLPRELVEVFAIDCAVSAVDYAAAYAADATDADAAYAAATAADATAAYAAYAADATAAYAAYAAATAAYATAAYAAYAADATAAYAAYAAAYAADAAYAAATAAYAAERERQLDCLAYLLGAR